jgi:hypothetical protein
MRQLSAGVMLAALIACATPPEPTPPAPTPTPTPIPTPTPTPTPKPLPPPTTPQINEASVLKESIAAYNNGEYNAAIKKLGAATEIWGQDGSKAGQLEALKYIAFSYCLTQRQALCRAQFERALKLDPAFDLAPGEKGHPLWGPVFAKAQKAAKKPVK